MSIERNVTEELRRGPLAKVFTPGSLSFLLFMLLLGVLTILSPWIVETNNAGWYLVKQAAGTGTMTVYTTPGMFFQGFGNVTRYKAADIMYFSKHEEETRGEDESILVRFNDGATANVTVNTRIELPAEPEKLLEIHKKFRSYDALIKETVKQVVSESVFLTAAMMSAEESYTTKRAEFSQIAHDQVLEGVYLTEAEVVESKNLKTGEITRHQIVTIQRSKDGTPDRKPSVLSQYGIRVTQFVIRDIDYSEGVDGMISAKQKALQETVSAKAQAEKATQDKLTAEEVGKKNVAVARYEKEVEKIQAVTNAEQKLEVAKLDKQSAEQYKLTQILKAEGDAEYRRKIMVADGALEKKLGAYVETQKAWADAFSKVTQPVVPSIVTGGQPGSTNAALNMMEILSIKAARDLSLDFSTKSKS